MNMETRSMVAALLGVNGEGGGGGREAGLAEWNGTAAFVVCSLSSLSAIVKRALAMFTVISTGNQELGLHLSQRCQRCLLPPSLGQSWLLPGLFL